MWIYLLRTINDQLTYLKPTHTYKIAPYHYMIPTYSLFFFLKNPPTPKISPLPLPDALPICLACRRAGASSPAEKRLSAIRVRNSETEARDSPCPPTPCPNRPIHPHCPQPEGLPEISRGLRRSEEHTSELQSPCNLVCRLLLE